MRSLKRIIIVLFVSICAGCDSDSLEGTADSIKPAKSLPVAELVAGTAGADTDVPAQELWAHSCALCHVDGIGGAPRIGNADEWRPRLEKGMKVLLQHTLDGFNQMPPLGYCMSCESDDFVKMIELMTEGMTTDGENGSDEQQSAAVGAL